jgi:NAD(P)H-flavin reductase
MSRWHQGRLLAVRPAAAGLWSVRVDVTGTTLEGAHALPGQYVMLCIEDFPACVLAIASAPEEGGRTFEFLVKEGNETVDRLVQAEAGTPVKLGAPSGPGFPLEQAAGRRVLLFATGSGISAIRSLIGAIVRDRARYGEVTLYFGARSPRAFAYRDELEDWERSGIRVVRTISQPDRESWQGTTGYVQSHLEDTSLTDAVAFVCGQQEMVDGVREALLQRGMQESNIFLNV